jgi:hypothetical protein
MHMPTMYARSREQASNPSIERTSKGVPPLAAAHVER